MGKLIKRSHVGLISTIFLSMLVLPSVNAQDEQEWWFDVEFAIFKRNLDGSSVEDFSAATFTPSNDVGMDLFSLPILKQQIPYLSVLNALPDCEPAPMPEIIDMSATLAEISESLLTALNEFLSSVSTNDEAPIANAQNEAGSEVTVEFSQTLTNLKISKEKFAQDLWLDIAKLPKPSKAQKTSSSVGEDEIQSVDALDFGVDLSLNCHHNRLPPIIDKVPQKLFSEAPYIIGTNGILSEDELKMKTFIESTFKQRDITPLLYTAWRQQVVFGEDNARFVRIFAGDKLAQNIDDNAFETPSSDNIENLDDSILAVLSNIEASLGSNKEIAWDEVVKPKINDLEGKQDFSAFEVEGLFKVYLDYVNRVPYLHIDSEFMHYRMALDVNGESKIEEFPFKQRRRIISKQIHYFDHPAIGILVRLHRYEPPVKSKVN